LRYFAINRKLYTPFHTVTHLLMRMTVHIASCPSLKVDLHHHEMLSRSEYFPTNPRLCMFPYAYLPHAKSLPYKWSQLMVMNFTSIPLAATSSLSIRYHI